MINYNELPLDRKIYNLISLPLNIVLKKIQEDQELNSLNFTIVIADKINFYYDEKISQDPKLNIKQEITQKITQKITNSEITKNDIQNFTEFLKDSKLRVINIKREQDHLKIYIAKEITELLNL